MIQVGYDDRKGRLAVAAKRIPAGTRLLSTPAHTAVSLTACNWCFSSSSLKACSGCAHSKECASWKQIPSQNASQTVLLVARMAAKLFLAGKDDKISNELLELRHHHDDHTGDKLREFEEMAQLVLVLLVRSKFNTNFEPFEKLQDQYAQQIIHLFCRVNCNAFSICDDLNVPVGIGMFPQAALLNHSCVPNCIVSFTGRNLQIQVVTSVEKGQELTISYVELFESTVKRQRALRASYFFDCDCVRCQNGSIDPSEDWFLDGFLCGELVCRNNANANSVVVMEERGGQDHAICKACGWEADPQKITNGVQKITEWQKKATDTTDPQSQWMEKQHLWRTVEQIVGCHPRSALYAITARALGNFLIENGPNGLENVELALLFLTREWEATKWVLSTLALPSRGLLFYQLAKLNAQMGKKEDARKWIRDALAILTCAYGSDQRTVIAAREFLYTLQ